MREKDEIWPRYRYNYKSVCWVLMNYHEVIFVTNDTIPMTLRPALHVEHRERLLLANAFDNGRNYKVF